MKADSPHAPRVHDLIAYSRGIRRRTTMNTYRLQVIADVPRGWTRDDLLAQVVGAVSAVTIVDRARTDSLARGGNPQAVTVIFQGLNDNEARETARRARASVQTSADTLLSRKDGNKFNRIES